MVDGRMNRTETILPCDAPQEFSDSVAPDRGLQTGLFQLFDALFGRESAH